MKTSFICLFLIIVSTSLKSQSVIRGPYMQTPTHNSIIFKWRTNQNTSTKVWFGTDSTNLNQVSSINNNVTDHTLTLTGLTPNTTYFYAVGNNSGILAGQTGNHRFKTNPLPGAETPVRIWAIGDFGKGNAGQINVKNSYVNYAGTKHTDVWMWLGDNVYNDGKDTEYQSKVFAYNGFSDIFSWLPFWPTPGNHDYNEIWAQSSFLGIPYSNLPLQNHVGPYYDIVDVPKQAEAGGYPSQLEVFYSFDYGNIHFLSLNSEVYDIANTNNGINQMKAWLIQDLQQNDKLFTIAYFHQPPYSKGSHNSDDIYELAMTKMREKIIPELENFDIDLVVCGHSHVFERSYLINGHYGFSPSFDIPTMMKNGTNGNFAQGNAYIKDTLNNNDEGTVYVVCGNSGSSETAPALNHPVMAYTDGGSNAYGSFVMDVKKNRLDGKYLKVDGTIGNEFTILKKNLVLSSINNQVLCQGDSINIQANYKGGSDSLKYEWLPTNYNTNSIYIKSNSITTYTLKVTDLLTGQIDSKTFNVTIIPSPTITAVNDTLFTQQGYAYQWYFNGNSISGATNYYLLPTQSGNYSVQLIQSPCANMSTILPYVSLGINDIETSFSIYPNPVKTKLHIKNNAINNWETIEVTNVEGKILLSDKLKPTTTEINFSNYAAGIYFINLSNSTKNQQFKVAKE